MKACFMVGINETISLLGIVKFHFFRNDYMFIYQDP